MTVTWTGTIPAGSNPSSACTLGAPAPEDHHSIPITVPANVYTGVDATFSFSITWTPVGGNETVSDQILTILDPAGGVVGSSDTSNTTEIVNATNLKAGTYDAVACPYLNAAPQDYTGKLVIKTTAVGTVVPPVPGPTDPFFASYDFPVDYQTRDSAQRPNAGEPSIGADWEHRKIMYMAGTQVTQVSFDDNKRPPAATYKEVTPPKDAQVNEDAILFTDHVTSRTVEGGLFLAGSNMSVSSDAGENWQPAMSPVPHGPDHQAVGGGPYPRGVVPGPSYPRAVYYCSQNILQAAGAFCALSQDGGVSYNPSNPVFAGSICGALHGHPRVSGDGTVYLPQNSCGGGVGMAISSDAASTWTYVKIPDSLGHSGGDPSVAAGPRDTVYYGYGNGDGHAKIAVSRTHGTTWSKSVDVGAPFGVVSMAFPEVIVGDDNRAAFAFLGTTTRGDSSALDFPGVWHMYVAFTYDGGATWQTVDATPTVPVQRGGVCGSGPCRNMLDFNDITVDRDGRVLVSYTHGCTAVCITAKLPASAGCDTSGAGTYSENASVLSTPTCSYGRLSALVRQTCGKGLFANHDPGFDNSCAPGAVPLAAAPAAPAVVQSLNPAVLGSLPDTAVGGTPGLLWGALGLVVVAMVAAGGIGLLQRKPPRS
ncbi:MAG: hypothetical protein NVS3B24_06910 [Candidatus Dormibacteria bacterium]